MFPFLSTVEYLQSKIQKNGIFLGCPINSMPCRKTVFEKENAKEAYYKQTKTTDFCLS